MFDGSKLSLEKNIATTKKVVELAHYLDVYTEAELGPILRVGEDSGSVQDNLANVEDCAELVLETGVDSLAPAIGTAHGVYTETPKIDFERLGKIQQLVNIPLVLHGGTGIPDEMIQKAISLGVLKINYGTMLKHTWSKTMKKILEQGELEIRKMIPLATEAVKEVARKQMRLFGSSDKS